MPIVASTGAGQSLTHGHAAVYGEHIGTYGFGVGATGQGAGAGGYGRCTAADGLSGEGKYGLRATLTLTGGYGAVIEGGKAQLRLVPSASTGKPTSGSHRKGELVMDRDAVLWFRTVAGSPGKWRKVATSAT